MSQHPSDTIKVALANLEADEKTMLDQATDMMQAHGGAIYEFDFLVCAAINRSVALSAGFRTMIRDQNFISAGALLRLQLDTAFRVFAGFIVDKPHEFAVSVLEGKHIRNMKDRNGQRMTDHYLVSQLVKEYPWIELVYENTSGYVHLSDKHFFNTFDYADREKRSGYVLKIGSGDIDFPDEIYLEAISAFRASTQILMRYVNGWIFTKANPRKVAAMKAAHAKNNI